MAALTGTQASSNSSTLENWVFDFTLSANLSVANGTSPTTATVALPATGTASIGVFNNSLPLACGVLPTSTIQGASMSLPAALGLTGAVLASNTITFSFINNNGASPVNVPSGSRIICVQVAGT